MDPGRMVEIICRFWHCGINRYLSDYIGCYHTRPCIWRFKTVWFTDGYFVRKCWEKTIAPATQDDKGQIEIHRDMISCIWIVMLINSMVNCIDNKLVHGYSLFVGNVLYFSLLTFRYPYQYIIYFRSQIFFVCTLLSWRISTVFSHNDIVPQQQGIAKDTNK